MLGEQIKTHRKRLGLSLSETARRAGMPKPSLCDIENGRVKVPGSRALYKLAGVLGVRMEDLLGVPPLERTARP